MALAPSTPARAETDSEAGSTVIRDLASRWLTARWLVAEKRQFEWPVSGPITNARSPMHPLGIDIGLAATPATPIRAVADGKVKFAGGSPCCSYGLYVVLEHEDDLTTLYAHLSRIDVEEGEEVRQSQAIGLSGITGRSTGEHLHFEVSRGDERLDPMAILPEPCPYTVIYAQYAVLDGDCTRVPR